ncbi:rhomboid family intramembrane serine protease [Halobellus ordinarius]|uniref:rhomboid family intramembrane serine protease n=1 Tax=Halobellus ordinarius TaxID=3075120 RepID=UPI00288017E5|nr:rhomboid family intramembrane serine protease [Halobellus sp. ZY16]
MGTEGKKDRKLVTKFRELEIPVTLSLVSIILLIYIGQLVSALLLEEPIPVLVSYLFVEYTAVAWILSPLLHYGGLHFIFNFVVIWGIGAVVEQTLSRKKYILFIILAAVGSTIGAYLAKIPFVADQIIAYGSSGIAYALATYSITIASKKSVSRIRDLASIRIIACLAGIVAVLIVAYDVLTGPYFTAEWFNGSHLGGAVIGLIAGRLLNSK